MKLVLIRSIDPTLDNHERTVAINPGHVAAIAEDMGFDKPLVRIFLAGGQPSYLWTREALSALQQRLEGGQ